MNFRTCKYFLATCEMGTINAAARSLYISQQSLSQHIKKLEEELDVTLFYRGTPLVLTEAGTRVEQSCRRILGELEQLHTDLNPYRQIPVQELTIGTLDYGIPEFMPALIDRFLKAEPNVVLRTREIFSGERLPADVPLFISARELGAEYKSEVLFYDQMVVCVQDKLLQEIYGDAWEAHRQELAEGNLHALDGCPFLAHRGTPLEKLSETVFAQNHFFPKYLPIIGTASTLTQLCTNGQAALISFLGQTKSQQALAGVYPLRQIPPLPTGYICYRANTTLSHPAQQFLDITRRCFGRMPTD